jgi:hypothetical protein
LHRHGVGRNTELFTQRNGKIVEVEVYFGWSIPHEAPEGGFVETTSAPIPEFASLRDILVRASESRGAVRGAKPVAV